MSDRSLRSLRRCSGSRLSARTRRSMNRRSRITCTFASSPNELLSDSHRSSLALGTTMTRDCATCSSAMAGLASPGIPSSSLVGIKLTRARGISGSFSFASNWPREPVRKLALIYHLLNLAMAAGDQLRYSVPRASCCAFTRTTERPRCSMTRHRGGFPPHLRAPCSSAEELREAIGPIWHYFGRSTPTDGAGAFPSELTVPGGRVPAAGLFRTGRVP